MFGISPIGWIHTIGSLPAIPVAAYMFVRHGRITPRTVPGAIYFVSMLIGGATVFLVAKKPPSNIIGAATIALLIAGYAAVRLPQKAWRYVETICLSLTAFLLMVPTVTEILRRVPDGHPIVTDLKDPLLLACQGGLFLALIVGLAIQIFQLRRQSKV